MKILQISAHRTYKKELEKGPPRKSLIHDFRAVMEEDAKMHDDIMGAWQKDGKLSRNLDFSKTLDVNQSANSSPAKPTINAFDQKPESMNYKFLLEKDM